MLIFCADTFIVTNCRVFQIIHYNPFAVNDNMRNAGIHGLNASVIISSSWNAAQFSNRIRQYMMACLNEAEKKSPIFFKCIFVWVKKIWISIKNSLKFVSMGSIIKYIPQILRIMLCRQATSPRRYLNQWWPSLLTHVYVTRTGRVFTARYR